MRFEWVIGKLACALLLASLCGGCGGEATGEEPLDVEAASTESADSAETTTEVSGLFNPRCRPPSFWVCWYDEANERHCYCTSRPPQ